MMTHVPLPPEDGDVEVGDGVGDGEVVPVLVVGGDDFTGGDVLLAEGLGSGRGRGFGFFGVATVITRPLVPPCCPGADVPCRVPAAG
jgi:hypothetical protein